MLTFLRKIRRSLITSDSARKYLLYAVGEIALVVMGILIALQVNEWNNERNRHKAQEAIVVQLKADLLKSIPELEQNMEFFLRNASASAHVTRAFWLKEIPENILMYLGRPLTNRIYSPVLGTARSLINSGNIELLSSDELKKDLISYLEDVDFTIKDISRYEETYYRKAREILNEAGPRNFWSKESINELEEAQFNSASYNSSLEMDINSRPTLVEKVPFMSNMSEYFQDERIYTAYNMLLISHRNIYFKYAHILENTYKLLNLIDRISGTSSITIDSINWERHDIEVDSVDLKIIQKADAILSDRAKWNKAYNERCEDDIDTGRISLFCAVYKASVDIVGEYNPRRPGVEIVNLIVRKYGQRRVVRDRIIRWNNHPDTTFDEIKKVLQESMNEIRKQL